MNDDPQQAAARRFVNEILRATGWSASALARRARISHSTLTRFLNKDVTHTLSTRTLAKIRATAATVIPEAQLDNLWLLCQRTPPAERAGRPISV